jgi:hypothetical protein
VGEKFFVGIIGRKLASPRNCLSNKPEEKKLIIMN